MFDAVTGELLGASAGAWRWLGWPAEVDGELTRLPAETYRPLPRCPARARTPRPMTPNPRDPQSVSLLADLSGHPPEGVLFWSGAGISVPPPRSPAQLHPT